MNLKNDGERKQLIVTLTNLSEIFRQSGFRSIAVVTYKKLRELDARYLSKKDAMAYVPTNQYFGLSTSLEIDSRTHRIVCVRLAQSDFPGYV